MAANGDPACVLRPLERQRHSERGRRHQHEHAGRVRAALGLDIGVEDDRNEERDAVNSVTSGRVARVHSGAMP